MIDYFCGQMTVTSCTLVLTSLCFLVFMKKILREPDDRTIISRYHLDFKVRDLRVLQGTHWLNDQVCTMTCCVGTLTL